MSNPSILLLTTYPTKFPKHGGQLRVSNMIKSYENNGFNVYSIAFYDQASYPQGETEPWDFPFPSDSKHRSSNGTTNPLITDFLTAKFATSKEVFTTLLPRIPEKLDFIEIEQPWLLSLALKIKALEQYSNIKIIYNSQNIEYVLKKEILEACNIQDDEAVSQILELEKQACQVSDIVVGVTDSDCQQLTQWGARNVVLARNGIEPWQAMPEKLREWQEKLPTAPFILYVASAHPPNFTNFNEIIGESLACIPPDTKLVIVGGVCEYIYKEVAKSRWNSLNLSRIELLFSLSNEDLNAVKELANAYFLPIPMGGGSNIKTAEALYSGKWVVSTSYAMRGFEQFTKEDRVKVCATPREVQNAIYQVLTSNALPNLNEQSEQQRNTLTWSTTLQPVVDSALKIYNSYI